MTESPDDLRALQRLRLARRRYDKMHKEALRACRKEAKAHNKLIERFDDVARRNLDPFDPRSYDS